MGQIKEVLSYWLIEMVMIIMVQRGGGEGSRDGYMEGKYKGYISILV